MSWYSSTSTCRKRSRHALAHVRLLVEQPERAHDQVAEVERAALGQQAVVVGVDARELELALRARPLGVVAVPGALLEPLARSGGTRRPTTSSSFSRSMRATKLASSGAGLPRIS